MESDQTEKTLTPDDLLIEALEALMAQGEPVGNFKSHYALMLACTKIVWGTEQKYKQGVLTLDSETFAKEPLSARMRILNGMLTDSLSDVFFSLKEKENKKR